MKHTTTIVDQRGGVGAEVLVGPWGLAVLDGLVAESAAALRDSAAVFGRKRVPAAAIHRLRIALRRLDAVLKALRPVVGDKETQSLRRLVHPLRRETGRCRDCDVGLALIRSLREQGLACKGLRSWLRKRRDLAAAALSAHDLDAIAESLVARWEGARSCARATKEGITAKRFARKRIKRTLARSHRLLNLAASELGEHRRGHDQATACRTVHELRLGIKSLRYRLEAFAALIDTGLAAGLSNRLATAQHGLGKAVDAWRLAEVAGEFQRDRLPAARFERGSGQEKYSRFQRGLAKVAYRRASKGITLARRALEHAARVV